MCLEGEMQIPVGVIKEWRNRQEEKRRQDEESRRPTRSPLQAPDHKRPRAEKGYRKPRSKIVINLS